MLKYLAIAGILLLSSSAHAGTISISITTVAQGTQTQSVTVSDANIARIIGTYKLIYGQVCDAAVPPICRDQTNAEAFVNLAQTLFTKLRFDVRQQEQSIADAAIAVVPMQ